MTAAQRSERAFLPLQRDHRLFVLTHNSPALRNFYALMSSPIGCQTTDDCCQIRNQYLGHRARQFVQPKCENMECNWDVSASPQWDATCP